MAQEYGRDSEMSDTAQLIQELLKRSFAITAHALLTTTHGVIGVIVGTENAQTLINKKFGGAVNYSEFELNGFLHQVGTAGGFDDVQFNITPKETGAGHPTLSTWNTDFKEFAYAVGDYANAQSQEAPHWWLEGSDWTFHIHWSTGSGNYVAGDKVKWEIRVSAADSKGEGPYVQFPAATVLVVEHEFTDTVLPFSCIRSIFPTFTPPASMTKIGAQVKVKLTRIAKSAGGTDPATHPFGLQVGAHARSDTRTSRTNGAK